MSNTMNSIHLNLETKKSASPDFGIVELNEHFNRLDPKIQEEILENPKLENQIELLKKMTDKDLQAIYDNLSGQMKTKVDNMPIYSRYAFLKMAYNKNQKQRVEPAKPFQKVEPTKPFQKMEPSLEEGEIRETVNPNDIFMEPLPIQDIQEQKKSPPSQAFDNLVKLFYSLHKPYNREKIFELEARFGTKGIKYLTKNDYDNVIKVLKSFGFETANPSGMYSLRARCEFLDSVSGRFKMSNIRTEINGLVAIEKYCRTNDIKTVYKEEPNSILFNQKRPYMSPDKKMAYPVNFDDFNFRVSLQSEEKVKKGIEYFILENWRKSKKEFRYLNRVTFTHPDYPILVDISITKSGNKGKDQKGFNNIIPVYTLDESNIFNNQESYEIELEVDNKQIGPGTKFQTPESIVDAMRKVIKYVLCGLQGTMYPVSYVEQDNVLREYMKMIWQDEYDPSKRITSQYFLGPNSITLQLINIGKIDENNTAPNINNDFVVTDKADGERHLLYISKNGKMYLIDTNMNVKFTGAKVSSEEAFDTLLDGELIAYDKNGKFINLFAAFDIYFHKNKDMRHLTFLKSVENKAKNVLSRHQLLDQLKHILKPVSILDISNKIISPINFEVKKFYPMSSAQTIFDGCKTILDKANQQLFEYETDGLIFTHSYYGVGANTIGKSGPKTKITWEYSFKWKPPQFNTIDFLVTTVKGQNEDDVIHSLFENGMATSSYIQYNEYKEVELRCGFNERTDGFINPCQDMIDDNMPEFKTRYEEKGGNDYLPKRFYPTEPYDPNAGICKLMLKLDESGAKKMFAKSGEVITDNSIVEFAYNIDAENGWNWEPLRVRHDKTSKLLRGEREYGNSYRVCNENWKSIHPTGRITTEMLMTGQNIPEVSVSEDVYYNAPNGNGKMKTESMKSFHNLYVKKLLITGVSKQGDTLIDYACGKAGDLPKWIASKLSFVFGIDYSADNLENRLDGACARYLKAKRVNKVMPSALFVHGNSAFNIRDGSGMLNDKAKQIANAIFANKPKDADKLGRGVAKQYGKGEGGFNISSCQFAIHYFFENPDALKGFLRNVAECTKLNGYFIGTSYDGKQIFNELKKVKPNEGIQINDADKKIWEIIKGYSSETYDDDSSSFGYEIHVYQESINQYISEYLVNYTYLDRVMEAYGFKLISREEALEMGLPEGTGMFSELFIHMLEEIKKNKFKQTLFADAYNMTTFEKRISFLNRYFVYKKVREVNIEKIQLELGEYEDTKQQRERDSSEHASLVAKEEELGIKTTRPKVKKLSNKLELIPATEALETEALETEALKPEALEPEILVLEPVKKIRKPREPKEPRKLPKKLKILNEDTQNSK